MSRPLRWIPEGGALVEATCRTVHGRLLLLPSEELNEIIIGILARAKRMYEVKICGFAFASNHYHLLLRVDDAEQLADFMRNLKSKLALETNRLTGWSGTVFDRRYEMAVVTEEEAAQVEIFKYILAQGVKEQLVERIQDWPGVHSFGALVDGTPMTGHWFDRSQEHAARVRGEEYSRFEYTTTETVILSKIPCWAHLSDE